MSPDAGQAHQRPQCLQTSLQVNVGEQYFKRSQYHVWLFCMNFHKSFKTYPKTHLITLVISKTDQVINVRYDKIVKGVPACNVSSVVIFFKCNLFCFRDLRMLFKSSSSYSLSRPSIRWESSFKKHQPRASTSLYYISLYLGWEI